MSSLVYNSFWEDLSRGAIDLDTDTIHWMLCTGSYTPNKDTHTRRSDVTNEVTGAGYTAGGQASTVTITKDTASDRIIITLGGVTWNASTITARYAVAYKRRGGAASADELICVVNFGWDISSSASAFQLGASTITIQN